MIFAVYCVSVIMTCDLISDLAVAGGSVKSTQITLWSCVWSATFSCRYMSHLSHTESHRMLTLSLDYYSFTFSCPWQTSREMVPVPGAYVMQSITEFFWYQFLLPVYNMFCFVTSSGTNSELWLVIAIALIFYLLIVNSS